MTNDLPILLANVNRPESHTLKVYESEGGYQALKKSLETCRRPT